MKPYELTYIISSDVKSEAAETLQKEVETFVQEKGGVIVKSAKTAPQSLAYPINRHSSGYFITLEFQADEKEVKPLKEKLEKDVNVLRHFIIVKRPMKIMKERRMRKPKPEVDGKPKTEGAQVYTEKGKKSTPKVETKDLEKKLDEILSE